MMPLGFNELIQVMWGTTTFKSEIDGLTYGKMDSKFHDHVLYGVIRGQWVDTGYVRYSNFQIRNWWINLWQNGQ